jgi:hypothetical protein
LSSLTTGLSVLLRISDVAIGVILAAPTSTFSIPLRVCMILVVRAPSRPPLFCYLRRLWGLRQSIDLLSSKESDASLGVFLLYALLGGLFTSLGFRFIAPDALDVVAIVYIPALLAEEMQRHCSTMESRMDERRVG